MNRLDDYLFTPEYISRGGPHDGGDVTARFLAELKAEMPEPTAMVMSTLNGFRFFAYCSACRFRSRLYDSHEIASEKAVGHNMRNHE